MLQSRVCCEHRVVGLDNGVRHRWCGVDTELELRLLAIVGGKTLENEGTETRTSSTTERVENKEALETIAVVGQPADLVHDNVNSLLASGVTELATDSCWQHLPCPSQESRDGRDSCRYRCEPHQ